MKELEKRIDNIESVSFREESDRVIIKIDTPSKSSFIFKENGTNLDCSAFIYPFTSFLNKLILSVSSSG